MDIRESLRRMRNAYNGMYEDFKKNDNNCDINESKKSLSMRDMLGRVRKRNMQEQDKEENVLEPAPITPTEQKKEEDKFEKYFRDLIVDIKFDDLVVFNDAVFWSGTIDDVVQWTYSVSPSEENSGVDIKYLQGFEPTDPENDEITKKIETFFDTFYKYWRNNELQVDKS